MRAPFDNMDNRWHSNAYVVWGREFDRAADRLGVTGETFAALTDVLAVALADDPFRFPTEQGTSYRVAPLRLPNGKSVRVRYRVTRDPCGATCCVLDHVVIPHWVPAT